MTILQDQGIARGEGQGGGKGVRGEGGARGSSEEGRGWGGRPPRPGSPPHLASPLRRRPAGWCRPGRSRGAWQESPQIGRGPEATPTSGRRNPEASAPRGRGGRGARRARRAAPASWLALASNSVQRSSAEHYAARRRSQRHAARHAFEGNALLRNVHKSLRE